MEVGRDYRVTGIDKQVAAKRKTVGECARHHRQAELPTGKKRVLANEHIFPEFPDLGPSRTRA